MSTDWSKYSSPNETRNRANEPQNNGIVALIAGGVRAIPGLSVKHSPDVQRSNQAHTDIFGIEMPHGNPPEVRRTEIRQRLFAQFREWKLRPEGLQ